MTQVDQAHLDGDRDKDKALITETMKLIGNSSYSKLITNEEKHRDIVYINESEIGTEIMDNHFYSLTELPDGYYEVEKMKKKYSRSSYSPQCLYTELCQASYARILSRLCRSINTFLVRTLSTVRWILTRQIWQFLETVFKVLSNQIFVKNSKKTSTTGSSLHSRPKVNVLVNSLKPSLKVTKSLAFAANHIVQNFLLLKIHPIK